VVVRAYVTEFDFLWQGLRTMYFVQAAECPYFAVRRALPNGFAVDVLKSYAHYHLLLLKHKNIATLLP
jgi:hypothetical protein